MFNHSLKKKFYTLQLPNTFQLAKGRSNILFSLFGSSKLFLLFWLTIGYLSLSVNPLGKLTVACGGRKLFPQAVNQHMWETRFLQKVVTISCNMVMAGVDYAQWVMGIFLIVLILWLI